MSKTLQLYYDLMSQPSRCLYLFLKCTKIPFEPHLVALRKGEHFTEQYAKNINRFKRVPCIIDGNFKLAESVAILRYLVREHPIDDHWYPKDSKKQARVDEYLEWQHLNTRAYCATFFRYTWLYPRLGSGQVSEEEIAECVKNMEKVLDTIENTWLANGEFIAGQEISIADLLAIAELDQPSMCNYDVTLGRPKIKAWMDLVRKSTQPYYDESTAVVKHIIESGKTSKLR